MESKSKADEYERFVQEMVMNFPRFKALQAFLSHKLDKEVLEQSSAQPRPTMLKGPGSLPQTISSPKPWESSTGMKWTRATTTPDITRLQFREDQPPNKTAVDIKDLENSLLNEEAAHELYIVHHLSPEATKIFGGCWNIDPQVFLDYLNILPKEAGVDKRPTKPAPWFRYEDIDSNLPLLRSTEDQMEHVHIRYVGFREYRTPDESKPHPPLWVTDRHEPELEDYYIQRVGGGYNPIQPEPDSSWNSLISKLERAWSGSESVEKDWSKWPKVRNWPGVMMRRSAVVWFRREDSAQWRRGIILLDPLIQSKQEDQRQFHSIFRQFSSRPLPGQNNGLVDCRISYSSTLSQCLGSTNGIPPLLQILHAVYQIVVSEWIVVCVCLERDLNALEWRFERSPLNDLDLEYFSYQLMVMSRRVGKYEALITDQLLRNLPSYWQSGTDKSDAAFSAIRADLHQAQELMRRNHDRIKEKVQLVTSMMSVRESKRSNAQNLGLVFLGLVTTIALPFNAFASVYNMNGEFAPGGSGWPHVLNSAIITVICTVGCYLFVLVVLWVRNRRTIY